MLNSEDNFNSSVNSLVDKMEKAIQLRYFEAIESAVVAPLFLYALDDDNIYPSIGQVCTWSNEQWAAYDLHRSKMRIEKPYLILMKETSLRKAQRCWRGPLLVAGAGKQEFKPDKHTWDTATLAIYLYTAGAIPENAYYYHTKYYKKYSVERGVLAQAQRDAGGITCIVFSGDTLRNFYIYYRCDMSSLIGGMAKLGIDIIALRQDVDEIMRFLTRKPVRKNRMNSLGQWNWMPSLKREPNQGFVWHDYGERKEGK